VKDSCIEEEQGEEIFPISRKVPVDNSEDR